MRGLGSLWELGVSFGGGEKVLQRQRGDMVGIRRWMRMPICEAIRPALDYKSGCAATQSACLKATIGGKEGRRSSALVKDQKGRRIFEIAEQKHVMERSTCCGKVEQSSGIANF